MGVIKQLVGIYEKEGFEVSLGLNSFHMFNDILAPFTYLFRDGQLWTLAGGIAMQEVHFLENLFESYHPRGIFVIGNSFGWSAMAMALLNKKAKTVAIDSGDDANSKAGIDMTNNFAQKYKLDLNAVLARSPEGVGDVCKAHFSNGPDFVFIDGLHTAEQIRLDYAACRAAAQPNAVFLFHDILNFNLRPVFEEIAAASGLEKRVLFRTPSGMCILYPKKMAAELEEAVNAFSGSEDLNRRMYNICRNEFLQHSLKTARTPLLFG